MSVEPEGKPEPTPNTVTLCASRSRAAPTPAAYASASAQLLDPISCHRALKARDARFDGRFFVAVSTTGIYCRPVCAARAPRIENCSFLPSAAAAEARGFRPCLRCRPELAPGCAAIDASANIAHRAAGMIEDGRLSQTDLTRLAAKLGVTDRHLRRVFGAQFGVSPVQYAQTQRLLLAKRLLTDTRLPIIEIAMASGFSSLRRFNAAFAQHYRLPPSRLRQDFRGAKSDTASVPGELVFEIAYRPPYDWPQVISFLGKRAIAGVESVDADTYRRTVRLAGPDGEVTGWLAVSHRANRRTLRLVLSSSLAPVVAQVLARVKALFDTDCRPDEVVAVLGHLAAARPGLRVPGAFNAFEMAVRAILGQQVSVRAAHTLAGRIARRFGKPLATGVQGLDCLFPLAPELAAQDPGDIAALGIVGARARALSGLARALAEGRLDLAPGGDVETTECALRALPGIGAWTSQYLAMRALRWPDAFPAADLGVLKALGVRTAAQAHATAQGWRPWRSYAVLHLWQSLEDRAQQSPA